MKIEGLLSERYITLNLELDSKTEVIDAMLSLVTGHQEVSDPEMLRDDVWKREKEMSTGIGKNIALPHAKTGAVRSPVLAMATLKRSINFDSIDKLPVRIIFLLATPDDMLSEHLKLLGRITRIAGKDEVREKFIQAASPREVLDLFRQEEKDLPQI
jgi:fructose PTS system EIIA component